ncbi:extracellular solute-binding protein [Acholeplasma sp. OttesenSCG-928-E16]|nr:extracellular solute-binding protein [Acholeplasma sp. OttesenSCG-928-E16]
MKKIFSLIMAAVFMITITACDNRESIKVYLPNEYLSEDVVAEFESEYNIRVDVVPFDSNEDAISAVEDSSNSFDVIVPSDYALEEMQAKGLLEEIDYSKITSFNKDTDLSVELKKIINKLATDDSVSQGGFDLLKYGAPYFWGNVGIVVNKNKIDMSDIEGKGWEVLTDAMTAGKKVIMYDSSRDAFMIALKKHFADNNITDSTLNNPTDQQLNAAESWLSSVFKNSNSKFAVDASLDEFLVGNNSEYALSVDYSGNAIYIMTDDEYENENLDYYVPVDGTNIWVDAMAIPKNASNKDGAYKFINFILSKDAQELNSTDMGYTSVRQDVIDLVMSEYDYPEAYDIKVDFIKDEIFRYNSSLVDKLNQKYISIKNS